jgi:acyl-CoA dehydrogenase
VAEITEQDFVAEATAFLEANARPKEAERKFVWGEGSDKVALFDERSREEELAGLAEAKAWRAKRDDAGLAWIIGPTELGGRGLPASFERLYNALEAGYEVPATGFFGIGLGMVAPTILAHGTEVTRGRYLKALYRGDLVACQLFSEPGAGSDLAGLQTRAVRDGDEWVVTGQKVWTSGAHYSDIGEIICRTDPDLPKHKGLTGFVVDMSAPGVEVRPLRQMTGGASFNEVFFNEVRIPDDHRLGDVNQGWAVALTTLMNERAAIGGGGGGGAGLTQIAEMMRHFGVASDPVLRDELMGLHTDLTVARLTSKRALDKIKQGQLPGPELSTAKLALTNNQTRAANLVASILGPRITADTGEWGTFAWSQYLLGVPGMRVAGGTDEVMKNIVAERVLGLPKDPGVDSKTPFRELRTN